MLAKVSIRTKITFVVSFLLLALVIMGLLAIRNMQSINANATDIQTNWLPSVRALSELRASILTYRSMMREHLLAETSEQKEAAEKILANTLEATNKVKQSYETMITSPEERALYGEWNQTWDAYRKATEEVIALSRQAVGRVPREAHDLNSKVVNPIASKSDELLRKDIDLNNRGADDAGKEAIANYYFTFKTLIAILIASAAIGIALGILLVRSVSRGIASIVSPMQEFAKGELDSAVPHQGEKTEIGRMADTLQIFKQALVDKRLSDQAASREAEEKIARGQRVDNITRAFEAMIGSIVQTVSSASTQLEASAGTLTASATRSRELATTVAAASEEASTNVQSVASATEEMASSVNEISRQVQSSAGIASQAVEQARRTNERVEELAKAAGRIGDVIELINTIAGQTNLLALNATIEAARAGEAGRGFAVVASEVKALAEQTAKATGEISQQVSSIQAATTESVDSIREIGETIGRMSEISSTIAAAVEEQGAATQEIARNVQQAAQGTMQVSSSITDVQRGASETGSASSQVLSAAQSLSTESSRLKEEVEQFLTSVRAA